ncbi:MAG: flagellar biosynthesis anti-sigma factor FlgM [Comamonadaceae bacterium]|nr:flagellar biosynthesis anti-sigma factor FlgM [Comamonadaceae bacterium]
MEINGKNPLTVLNANVQRLDLQQPLSAKPVKADELQRAGSDRIELSIRGREIQQMDELIRSVPDVREAKVEQIRSAIEMAHTTSKRRRSQKRFWAGI